ncbi:MAG TPA: type II toxin-antitoxin system VapC family toxin [Allosphingosinicella sp.]|jgi:tRNA(fMet)-specific endonuclease VapC
MRFLLDTNILIRLMVNEERGLARRMRIHSHEIALSAIVMHELYFGAFAGSGSSEQIGRLDRLRLPLLAFDADDARVAAEIRADLRRKGTPIGPYDLLIAGQALARGLVVVTRNVGEFARVAGLAVEDWR